MGQDKSATAILLFIVLVGIYYLCAGVAVSFMVKHILYVDISILQAIAITIGIKLLAPSCDCNKPS